MGRSIHPNPDATRCLGKRSRHLPVSGRNGPDEQSHRHSYLEKDVLGVLNRQTATCTASCTAAESSPAAAAEHVRWQRLSHLAESSRAMPSGEPDERVVAEHGRLLRLRPVRPDASMHWLLPVRRDSLRVMSAQPRPAQCIPAKCRPCRLRFLQGQHVQGPRGQVPPEGRAGPRNPQVA